MISLVRKYAISDRTFQLDNIPSWHAHMELATATLDGFVEDPGTNPMPSKFTTKKGPGWGCDSFRDVWWSNGGAKQLVPSCVPDKQGKGPYRPSPVQYVPTIMDRLDAAGLSWRIYDGDKEQGGYWGICPGLYECFNPAGTQRAKFVGGNAFIPAAKAGNLPSFSIVIPRGDQSQHGGVSMKAGDNWLSSLVKAVMVGSDWDSTAIFITYDDCGCFYDHVAPPPGLGVRVPMLIVSPWVKPHYTDHATASIISMLSFTEHNFGLAPLTQADATAYDYRNSFDYNQIPLPPIDLRPNPVPKSSLDWIAKHPPDPDDPEWAT
jgi:phospholipase C